ncbi:fibronectin type III domain-containing protein [Flavobacterium hauense]
MKKITLMIVVSLMSFFAYAQLPVNHFDDPWVVPPGYPAGTPAAPPNWVVINEYGPQQTWVQTTPNVSSQPPFGGTGHSAYLQKENVGPTAAIPSDWLITEAFPMIANAQLGFQSRLTIGQDSGGVYKVYLMKVTDAAAPVTVADFTNLTTGRLLKTYTETELDPTNFSQWTAQVFEIPNDATFYPAGTQVRLAFVMQGDDKDRWFLDDVKVTAKCLPPTNGVVTATTTTTASLSWTVPAPAATSWEIEVVLDTAVPTGVGQVYSGPLPYTKTGLTPCTNYKYYVRSKCSDDGTSAWLGPVFFKARCLGETCAEPLVIPPGNQSVSGNTSAFADFYEGLSGTGCNSTGNYLAGNDVVYSYTPNATGVYNISLTGTGGPAGVFMYSSCANIGVACINGGVASATTPVNIPAQSMTAGTTYYFVISTNGTPQTTNYTLAIQQVFCALPTAGTAVVSGMQATLGWTKGTATATSWEIAVQNAGAGLPAAGAPVNTVATNTGNVVGSTSAGVLFSSATTYEYYVRESCGGGQFSIWSGPYQFTTTQVPAPMNYTQNFDGAPHGFTLNNGTQVNKWVVGGATNNSPANSLYISNNGGTTNDYSLTTPSIVQAYRDIQMPLNVGQIAISFDWKAFGESCCDYLKVYMVPSSWTPTPGTAVSAATSGGTQIGGTMNVTPNWTNFNTIITAPTSWNNSVMRLVFEWTNDDSVGTAPSAAIDNINLSIVTCPQPTALVMGPLNTTSGVVNWTAPAIVPASYDVYVSNTPVPVPTATTVPTQNVPGTTATITPLAASTFYYVWVRAHCSDTDKSFWTGPISFSTPQVPDTMPYTQNFDGGPSNFTLSNGNLANKWVVGGATFASAANSLYISNTTGTTNAYDNTLAAVVHAYRDITIPTSVPSGQALLQFDYKTVGENADYFRVWNVPVSFTPTPGTLITAAASGGTQIGGNFTGSPTWKTSNNVVAIPAADLNTPRRIIFEWRNDGGAGTNPPAAIDNINFKVITCPAPLSLGLDGAPTNNSATVIWTAPALIPGSYDYYYSTNTTPPTDTTTPTGNVVDSTVSLSGLADATSYNVWVRSNCGASGTSFWIGPLNFYTAQVPASVPYAQNFDGGAHSFTLLNGAQANKWFVGPATFNSAANSLYITNDNGVSNAYTTSSLSVTQAYRDIQIPAASAMPSGQLLVKFDWKAQGESIYDYFRVWVVPATWTPSPGAQITAATSGGVQVSGGNFNLNGGTTWTTSTNVVNVPATWNSTTQRIVFEWRNDGGGGAQPPAAVDNIEITIVPCAAPTALVLGGVTPNTATVNWTAPAMNPGSYDYYYSTSATPPTATTVPSNNVTPATATITGLTDNTNYNVWVRSNCGSSVSFWTGPLNFTTPQIPATMPYTQNFDGTDNPSFTLNSGTQVNKWVIGTATFNSAAKSLYISNDEGVTNNYTVNTNSVTHAYRDVLLPTPIASNQVVLKYDWKALGESCCDYLRVWIVPVTFVPTPGTQITTASGGSLITANLNNNNTWTTAEHLLDVTGMTGARRIVFEWRNDGSGGTAPAGAIDNISARVVTCPQPTALTATGIGMTSATLGWTEALAATSWEVYVVPVNAAAPLNTDPVGVGTTVSSTTPLYEGLTSGTKYKYYVRALCGPNDVSRWSGPYNFNTNVCEIVDQCPINFVMTDTGDGWNGNTVSILQAGQIVATIGSTFTSGAGPVTVTVPLCKGVPYELLWNAGGTGDIGLAVVNPFSSQTVFSKLPGSGTSEKTTVIYEGMSYCSTITCDQPTNLVSESVVNVPNATRLSWTPGGAEEQWEVVIQSQGGAFPSQNPVTSVIVDDPYYVFANLVEGTLYEYYVRALCGTNDKSFWSGEVRFSLFSPPACADVVVTDPDLNVITPDTEFYICPGENACVEFDASYYAAAAETTSYEVTSIPFVQPFPSVGGTEMPIDRDDIWSPKIVLPFEFCFMGSVYNAAQVGSNGIVSFNANQPAYGGSGYAFTQTIPNPAFPQRNAIYGVYQDTDPSPGNNDWDSPNINYQVLGNYPCRALVVSFNGLAQFNCSDDTPEDQLIGAQSSQIVIYEITNIIEVYVKRRVPCTGWQGGVGLVGIQNGAGDVGFTPPGRNTGPWTAENEAWRFTPNGATSVDFEWLKDGGPFSTDTHINVCATSGKTVMTARASYVLCSGEVVVRDTDFTINVEEVIIPATDPVDITKCGNGEDVTFDLAEATANVFADPTGYVFEYYPTEQDAIDQTNGIATPAAFVTNATVTVWVRIMRGDAPCYITRSFEVDVTNVPPVFSITPDATICDDVTSTIAVTPGPLEDFSVATYSWTRDGGAIPDTTSSITTNVGGIYVVTVNNHGCVSTGTSTLTVYPKQTVVAPVDVTACDSYELPALTANGAYYTGAGGTGTQLNAGTVIGIDAAAGQVLGAGAHTIYVYAASGSVACSAEDSFVVTINVVPQVGDIEDVKACDSYALTAPAVGSYYTAPGGPNGTGTLLADDYVVTSSETIYVYAETATTPNCFTEDRFRVTISPTPVADALVDVTECDQYILTALSPLNTYWTGPGKTGLQLNVNDPVTSSQRIYVYAEAQDNPACNDEKSFMVNIIPSPQFTLGGPYTACVPSFVTISVTGANFDVDGTDVTYKWFIDGIEQTGQTGKSIVGSAFGDYQVEVTRGGLCSHSETATLSQDTTVILISVIDNCEKNVYSLEATDVNGSFDPDTATYSWTGPEFTSTDRKIVPEKLGEYVVTITTPEGCVSTESFDVTSTACDIPRGISPNNDGFNDEFDLTALGVRKLSIFNRYGQEVYSRSNYTKEWVGQTDKGDELPTGTYFYMVERTTGESLTGWVYINRQD